MTGDERRLIERCLAHDQDACEELVRLFAPMVGTVIWRATGDRHLTEDLAQETFMRVFTGLPCFSGRAKLSTWVYTVAHHVALDHLRRCGTLQAVFEDASGEFLDEVPGSGPGPEAITARYELNELLREAIAGLPEKYRLPLVYSSIEGLDHESIGAMLGVRATSVKTLVFRARQMLRSRLMAALNVGCAKGSR